MGEDNKSLLNLVNASGFLFQIGVADEIEATSGAHHWHVLSREHRWLDRQPGKEEFIDLVVGNALYRLVIECKKVQDQPWVFLMPDDQTDQSRTRLLWTLYLDRKKQYVAWDDLEIMPETPESTFCVLRGQGDGLTMLERISGGLLRSVEALAQEELALPTSAEPRTFRLYFPLIVTNAPLQVCRFSPGDIDLHTGTVDAAEFENVPMVRFRKSLSTTIPLNKRLNEIEDIELANERTVLVVNASALSKVLQRLQLFPPPHAKTHPWSPYLC